MSGPATPPQEFFIDYEYTSGEDAPEIDANSSQVQECARQFHLFLEQDDFTRGTWNSDVRTQSPATEKAILSKAIASVHTVFGDYNKIVAQANEDSAIAHALQRLINAGPNAWAYAGIPISSSSETRMWLKALEEAQESYQDKFFKEWAEGNKDNQGVIGDECGQKRDQFICIHFATMVHYLYDQEEIPNVLCVGLPNRHGLEVGDMRHAWVEVPGENSLYVVEATMPNAVENKETAISRVIKCAVIDDLEAKLTENGKVYICFTDEVDDDQQTVEEVKKLYQALDLHPMTTLTDLEKQKMLQAGNELLLSRSVAPPPSQEKPPSSSTFDACLFPNSGSGITYQKVNQNSRRFDGFEFVRVQGTPWQIASSEQKARF